MSWCCALPARIHVGATSGSSVSWQVRACVSRPRRSPRSSGRPVHRPPTPGLGSAGVSSCVHMPSRCSPATSSPLRRSGSDACTCSSSSSSVRDACTSLAAPPTLMGAGQRSRRAVRLVTLGTTEADPFPDPRPRHQIQPRLRRRLPQRGCRDHPHPVPGAERERVRRTLGRHVRRDCLDWLLIARRRQLERVLNVYVDHYNRHRPHRALELKAPIPGWRPRLASPRPPVQIHHATDSAGSSTNLRPSSMTDGFAYPTGSTRCGLVRVPGGIR
jgi:hypothetical protein